MDPRAELEQVARRLMETERYTAPAVFANDLIDAILADYVVAPRSQVVNVEYAWRHNGKRGVCRHRATGREDAIEGAEALATKFGEAVEAVERVGLDWNVLARFGAEPAAKSKED